MASATDWFRRPKPPEPGVRALTASATRLSLNDRKQTRQMRILRQGWQEDAWGYYDSIGELRYATEFLANCTARMKLYPAAYPKGAEDDNPVPLGDVSEAPEAVISACAQAMADLGNGKLAVRDLLHSASTNKTIAGEMFLLGRQDPETGKETWTVRSVDELVIYEDKYKLREAPVDPQGILGWIELDPKHTVISRIWQSHPRFRILAISPLRSILDDCESLLIHRRTIRAVGRSRLAGPGLLLWPEEATMKEPLDDNTDPQADPVMGKLIEAMMEPISEEGTAASVVPILMRLPGDVIDKVKLIDFAKLLDPASAAVREEMVGVIATGLDLPKEVVTGIADLNHWSAWQVDDNTFRHHVEPHVIGVCDGLTGGFLHPYLRAMSIPEYWVQRCLFWYDPTELVTHPDQTADAKDLYDRHAISAAALARVAGFSEEDAPTPEETVVRMLQNMRTPPPNLVMAAVHQMFPTLTIPPVETAGTIPGVKPSGVDPGEPPAQLPPGAEAAPIESDDAPPATEPTAPGPPSVPGLTASAPSEPPNYRDRDKPTEHCGNCRMNNKGVCWGYGNKPIEDDKVCDSWEADSLTAAARQDSHRLSRKLAQIDRDLRTRLQTAANAAMLRHLERIGAKLRISKVAKDETLKAKIAHRPNERVSAIFGKALVAATGVDAESLMGEDWGALRSQFYEWTKAAQASAIATAIRIGSLAHEDDAVKAAQAAMDTGLDAGWEVLQTALTNLGQHLLYNPDPNVGPGEWADLNPDTLVPTGTIRGALAVAGGVEAGAATLQPAGQIGTGSTISELLIEAALTTESYEWEHGPSLKPFDGHLDLDGVQFADFDSEALANNGDWPDNAYFFPGDHQGCSCDFTPLWVQTDNGSANGGESEAS